MWIGAAGAGAGNVQRKTTKLHERRYGVARATIRTQSPGSVKLRIKHEESANDHEDKGTQFDADSNDHDDDPQVAETL